MFHMNDGFGILEKQSSRSQRQFWTYLFTFELEGTHCYPFAWWMLKLYSAQTWRLCLVLVCVILKASRRKSVRNSAGLNSWGAQVLFTAPCSYCLIRDVTIHRLHSGQFVKFIIFILLFAFNRKCFTMKAILRVRLWSYCFIVFGLGWIIHSEIVCHS